MLNACVKSLRLTSESNFMVNLSSKLIEVVMHRVPNRVKVWKPSTLSYKFLILLKKGILSAGVYFHGIYKKLFLLRFYLVNLPLFLEKGENLHTENFESNWIFFHEINRFLYEFVPFIKFFLHDNDVLVLDHVMFWNVFKSYNFLQLNSQIAFRLN